MQVTVSKRTMHDGVERKKGGKTKMTQAEKDKIIKDLQDKLAEAEKIVVEPNRWKPKEDEDYWLIIEGGNARVLSWNNDNIDEWFYLTGNCFKTEEEAEEYKKQIEYTARYKNYIEEHSKPIDWKNATAKKYFAQFCFDDNEVSVGSYYSCKEQGTIHASSEQIIWDAIKEIGEDNFKKYVLGVK